MSKHQEFLGIDNRQLGLFQVVLSSLIRGFQGFFVRVTAWTPNHTIPLSFFRLALPALFAYCYLGVRGKRIRGIFTGEKVPLHLTSLLTAIRMSFFFLGYAYADMSSATVVFFSSGIFITLLEPIFLGEKLSRRALQLALLGFLGVLFVFMDQVVSLQSVGLIGLFFMAISCVLVVFENICKKRFVERASNMEWVFYQGFASSLILLPTLFFFPLPDLRIFYWILFFSFLMGVVAFMLDTSAMRKVRLSDLAVTRYVEPMATMVVGFALFHEQMTVLKLLGAAVIFFTVYLVFKNGKMASA